MRLFSLLSSIARTQGAQCVPAATSVAPTSGLKTTAHNDCARHAARVTHCGNGERFGLGNFWFARAGQTHSIAPGLGKKKPPTPTPVPEPTATSVPEPTATPAPSATPISAPVAHDDEYFLNEDMTLSGPNVLGNDEGAAPLGAVLVSGPQNGTLALNPDGSFTYVPRLAGDDGFSYRATTADGTASEAATVTLHVAHVNHLPSPEPHYYYVDASGSLSVPAPGVLERASDPDIREYGALYGDKLSVSLLPTEHARYGTVTLHPDGSFEYLANTPLPASNVVDSFYYIISDGVGGQSVGRVDLPFQVSNHAPVAQSQSLSVGDPPLRIALSGTDADGDALSYELISLPTHGTLLTPNYVPVQTGSIGRVLLYQPLPPGDLNSSANDSFSFRVRDGRGLFSAPATVTIGYPAANHAPVAVDDEVTSLGVVLSIPVLANDFDADGDALTITDYSSSAHGGTVSISADGKSLIYIPASGFFGDDSFPYSITDTYGKSASATVRVHITAPYYAGIPAGLDAWIGAYASNYPYIGYGFTNADGSGQIAQATTFPNGNMASYVLGMTNTGNAFDTLVLRGPATEPSAAPAHWRVRYFDTYNPSGTAVEITDRVTSAQGWETPALVTNQVIFVRVEITSDATVADGTISNSLFTVTSGRDFRVSDVVGAQTAKTFFPPPAP